MALVLKWQIPALILTPAVMEVPVNVMLDTSMLAEPVHYVSKLF